MYEVLAFCQHLGSRPHLLDLVDEALLGSAEGTLRPGGGSFGSGGVGGLLSQLDLGRWTLAGLVKDTYVIQKLLARIIVR